MHDVVTFIYTRNCVNMHEVVTFIYSSNSYCLNMHDVVTFICSNRLNMNDAALKLIS